MSKNFLIFTSSPDFGEFIHQALEEHGHYLGSLISDSKEAKNALVNSEADFLILDGELGEETINLLVKIYREKGKQGKIMLIPPEDDDLRSIEQAKHFDLVFTNPFYLPDLTDALDDLFGRSQPSSEKINSEYRGFPGFDDHEESQKNAPHWIKDMHLAAQYLMRLSLESSAQGAIISYKDQIWAYSGELSQRAAALIAQEVDAQWKHERINDIARFVQLEESDSDYMLYATSLGGHYALALVFDTKIPFSKMREQASLLAQSLAKEPAMLAVEPIEANKADTPAGEMKSSEGASEESMRKFQAPEFEPAISGSKFQDDSHQSESNPKILEQKDSAGLVFTYVHLPRMPHHHLDGDIREQISIWLPQLCVAYGWRLEHFDIRSDHLRWTVVISSEESPISVSQIMERQLSQRIFKDFARLAQENPSGEFWARGALIVSGDQISLETIKTFIGDTRSAQGITLK